jgi:hypothetical protein
MLTNKFPQRLYGILERYNKADILGVPTSGNTLYRFKLDYYEFQTVTKNWESNMKTKIGQKVTVRFDLGWEMYLRYFILRATGHTKKSIDDGPNLFNYSITSDDAERVVTELMSDADAVQQTTVIKSSLAKVVQDANLIASTIRE